MPPSIDSTWKTCLDQLLTDLPEHSYNTWIRPIQPLALAEQEEGLELRLGVPTSFHLNWLRNHFDDTIADVARSVLGPEARVAFDVCGNAGQGDGMASDAYGETESPEARVRVIQESRTEDAPVTVASYLQINTDGSALSRLDPNLNPQYTFYRFVEGDCNRLARSAALAVAGGPGETSFNPLFIYGGVGLGKTHLAQAIGNESRLKKTARHILYTTCEEFTSAFIRAVQQNNMAEFTTLYGAIDLLIVDDIQFLEGKEKTQEEFFYVFNQLHQRGKQIVLCADRPPAQIPGIEERLLSRFQWGLSVDVQPPDLETRIAILQRKAQDRNIKLSYDIVEFLAANVQKNIRNLEGALNRLTALTFLGDEHLTIESVRHLLRDMLDRPQRYLEVSDIKQAVAQHYGLRVEQLSNRNRRREVSSARQVAMYLTKTLTQHSLASIGNQFGGRDHSTVIHACRTVEDRMEVDETLSHDVQALRSSLESGTF